MPRGRGQNSQGAPGRGEGGRGGLTQLDALVVRVQQEGPEAVGDVVVGQELQVVLAELKLHGELQVDLRGGDNDQPTHYHHHPNRKEKLGSDAGQGVCLEEYIINKIRFVYQQGEHTQVTYLTKRRFHSAGCGFPDFSKNYPED